MFAMVEHLSKSIPDQALLDPAKLRVLSDPQRSFIVYSLASRAKTVKALAAELGCPPTRLYYHMQQLEKHGLVFVEETRLVSGIVEKHYRALAREWVLDRAAFQVAGGTDASRVDALLGFVFDQSRLEVQRQVETGAIDLRLRAPAPGALVAWRNVLKLDRAQAATLYARLTALWQEYEALAREPAEGGDFYAFAVALYPNGVAPPAAADPKEADAP
jgi:predicted ArsR family transcriptional regulator